MQTIDTTEVTIAPTSAPTIIFPTPTENHGTFTRYARFTSCDATDGSSNCNFLLLDSMKLSTSGMTLGVYRSGYENLTRLYTVSGDAIIQLGLLISFVD